MPHAVRGLVVSVASGVLAVLLLFAGARWLLPPTIAGPVGEGGWTARERAWFSARGFSPAELDAVNDRHFAWTGQTARLVSPELSRAQPHRLTLVVRAGRPASAPPPPTLTVYLDGTPRTSVQTTNEPQRITIDLPARPSDGAVIALDVSNTFIPSADDRRTLGVMVDEVALEPGAGLRPSSRVAWQALIAVAAAVLGVLLCGGFGRALGAVVGVAVAAGEVWLLLHDAAFAGGYADRLVAIGVGAAAIGGGIGLVRMWRPSPFGLPELWTAAGLVLAGSLVKLAVLVHPLVTVGDAIFQVHRAQAVHAGSYYFTSITPRPFFEFPYPVALFVVAQPFWSFFPTELDLARLLRGITLAGDALAGLAIYAAARRHWGDARVALVAAALWPFARAPFQGLCNANLTNVFGQGLFGVAMGIFALSFTGARTSRVGMAAGAVALAIAFLSHFSTLVVGLAILGAAAAALLLTRRATLKRFAVWVVAATVAASAVSYVVYYSHFTDVFRKTAEQVATTERVETTRSIAATPAVKARLWATGATNDYGLPGLPLFLAACAGGIWLIRARRHDAFTRILAAWAFVWIAFSALGILTPVEMRASLATAPVFVALGAFALAGIASSSRAGVALAVAGGAVIVWDAVSAWARCLGH